MALQADLEASGLASVLEPLLQDASARERMAATALARGRPDAAREIVSLFLTLTGS
jgi:UDP-N-acetylglucosamine:LPS N-acetylglucosamine transferase